MRRLELREPVRGGLVGQRAHARLANLRQPRRRVRDARPRPRRGAQRRQRRRAKLVQRQRGAFRDGHHRHRARCVRRKASLVETTRARKGYRRRTASTPNRTWPPGWSSWVPTPTPTGWLSAARAAPRRASPARAPMRQASAANARGADVARDSRDAAGIQRSWDSRTARARRRLRLPEEPAARPGARPPGGGDPRAAPRAISSAPSRRAPASPKPAPKPAPAASRRIAPSPTASPGPRNRAPPPTPAGPSAAPSANASSKSPAKPPKARSFSAARRTHPVTTTYTPSGCEACDWAMRARSTCASASLREAPLGDARRVVPAARRRARDARRSARVCPRRAGSSARRSGPRRARGATGADAARCASRCARTWTGTCAPGAPPRCAAAPLQPAPSAPAPRASAALWPVSSRNSPTHDPRAP